MAKKETNPSKNLLGIVEIEAPNLPVLLLFGPVEPSLPLGVNVLRGDVAPEEHVEQLLGGELRLEAPRVRVLVARVLLTPSRRGMMHLLFGTVQIVGLALLGVGQNCDRISDRFERFDRAGSLVFIGVQLKCKLFIRLLDIRVGSFLSDSQYLVVVLTSAMNSCPIIFTKIPLNR